MKSLVCVLLLFLANEWLQAQPPHLVTIAELKQLATCPEYTCLGSLANTWGYTYKGPQKGKISGLTGVQYRYVRPHPNPAFAEFTVSYWDMGNNMRRVVLRSDNKAWIAGLTRDIGQNGFATVGEKSTLGYEDKYYELTKNGMVWHLIWQQPSMFTDTSPHTITVYHDPFQNDVNPVALSPRLVSSPNQEKTSSTPAPEKLVVNNTPQETSASCGFKWTPWSNVSAMEKAAMRKVMLETYPFLSLLDYIDQQLANGFKIRIAYHTFDKQPCYLVYREFKDEPKGEGEIRGIIGFGQSELSQIYVKNLCDIRRADKGKALLDENNTAHNFLTNYSFIKDYRNFLKATNQTSDDPAFRPVDTTNRLGAATPEELAMLLLRCLKTNDKATWLRCMHPDEDAETDELSARRFDQYRECLDERGITNWSSVLYSRMTHLARPNGGSKVDLTQTRSRISIEFTYKNQEFVGSLSFGAFSKLNGKWLVWSGESFEKCQVMRSMH